MSDSLDPKTFFSAFDIAFFAPGIILFCGLLCIVSAAMNAQHELTSAPIGDATETQATESGGTPPESDAADEPSPPAMPLTVQALLVPSTQALSLLSILQLVFYIVVIYTLGLTTHAASWLLFRVLPGRTRSEQRRLPTDQDDLHVWHRDANYHIRFADYFWYLRSTSWNLGMAVLFTLLIWCIGSWLSDDILAPSWYALSGFIVVASLLIGLGFIYDDSYHTRKALVAKLNSQRLASPPQSTAGGAG